MTMNYYAYFIQTLAEIKSTMNAIISLTVLAIIHITKKLSPGNETHRTHLFAEARHVVLTMTAQTMHYIAISENNKQHAL